MTNRAALQALLVAVERYFDLMFDGDIARFGHVFAPSVQLHGASDGKLRSLTAEDYKRVLASAASPRSKNAPRQEEILLVDIASPTQAIAKVRVRIDTVLYLDYLAFHLVGGEWLITAKSFHVEARY